MSPSCTLGGGPGGGPGGSSRQLRMKQLIKIDLTCLNYKGQQRIEPAAVASWLEGRQAGQLAGQLAGWPAACPITRSQQSAQV